MGRNRQQKIAGQLEAMPIDQARKAITTGAFAEIGSPDYDVALSWLVGKEAELRDKRDLRSESMSRKALFNSRLANIIAIIAILLSIIIAIFI